MGRCKHAEARPARSLDEWMWCPDCRQFVKPKEVLATRFAQEH